MMPSRVESIDMDGRRAVRAPCQDVVLRGRSRYLCVQTLQVGTDVLDAGPKRMDVQER